MTQKELLYFEDAVWHEDSIIKILTNSIDNLDDEELINFMQNEVEKHSRLKQELMDMLGEKNNG